MIRIFTDFDGTITRRDVGDAFFEHFGGARSTEAVKEYRAGNISAVECFRRECAACGTVGLSALHEFIDREEIDESFGEFAGFCRAKQFALTVVSDGMDYYIARILRRHGLGDVPVHANTLELVPAGDPERFTLVPRFPNRDEICDRCASCKRNYLITTSADDDIIVYVGEGYSDTCPAGFADIVFAKDELGKFCRDENISFFEYRSFTDVTGRLSAMFARTPGGGTPAGVHKRRRAELARRDIHLGG